MVHRAWMMLFGVGNAEYWDKLNKRIQGALGSIDAGMIGVLYERSKLSKKDAEKYINDETYFQPKDCIKNGVATAYCADADDDSSENARSEDDTNPNLVDIPLEFLAEV